MYKDQDRQREANRKAKRAQRARDNEPQGMTLTDNVIPKADIRVIPKQGVTVVLSGGNMDIETLAMVDAGCGDKLTHGLKRGKDIKCFADLPPDIQETINMMSRRDGKIDPIEKANRTAIAISYEHIFPD